MMISSYCFHVSFVGALVFHYKLNTFFCSLITLLSNRKLTIYFERNQRMRDLSNNDSIFRERNQT